MLDLDLIILGQTHNIYKDDGLEGKVRLPTTKFQFISLIVH